MMDITHDGLNGNITIPFQNRLYTLLVSLFIIGDVYVVPHLTFLSWGLLSLIILSPYFISKSNRIQCVTRQIIPVLVFCLYSLIISIISICIIEGSARDVIVRIIRESFFYIIIFVFGTRFFHAAMFKNYISKISLLLATFIILQALVYYASGYFIPGLIPNVQINDAGLTGKQMYDGLLRYASYHGFIKVNGFLCEPAHCAHFLFVYLLILLFDSKESDRRNFTKAIYVSFAMIATMSTNAFLELIIAWLSWMIIERKKRALQVVLFALVGITAFAFIMSKGLTTYFTFVFNRFSSIFGNDTVSMTASARVLKGSNLFQSLDPLRKVFGIGFGSYNAAVENGIINVGSYDIQNEYMSSIWYILISSGLIGMMIYLSYFINLFKSRDNLGRILIISIIVLSFGTSIYCSAIYVWMMLLINYHTKEI